MIGDGDDFQHSLDSLRSYDDAVSLGTDCIQSHASSNWMLGDLAARVAILRDGDPLLEEKTWTLKRFAAAIGEKFDRIKRLSAISAAVPPDIRSERLSHAHYRVLVQVGFSRAQIIAWAAKAEDENWNAAALAVHVKKHVDAKRPKAQREAAGVIAFLRMRRRARGVTALGARDLAGQYEGEIANALQDIRNACDIIEAACTRRRMKRRRA